MMTQHTLQWGALVKTKHGDDLKSWPKLMRTAASAAIERGKQHLREKEGEFAFVSQRSSCTEAPGGGFELYLELVVRMTGAAE